MEMEGVVKGIQADMTKLSKSQSFTSNTVSKLLDKSRKLSVTMKEVSEPSTGMRDTCQYAALIYSTPVPNPLTCALMQIRDKMERQGMQVKKLEANHAHLINRNNFKVLIFQVSDTPVQVGQRSEVRHSISCSEPLREYPGFPVFCCAFLHECR